MKNNKKNYYSLFQNEDSAVLNIFGDITSFPWFEGDVSNIQLSKKLEEMKDVSVIDVYINSYGGEVAEGLAIYNALKRHNAKIRTHVDGFACSIASVIFMAGEERIMPNTSCLMIHNPWVYAAGNASELRKQADDLDTIGECSINAYMEKINITEEELKSLLDQETWLSPSEALEKGFATSLDTEEDEEHANQSVKGKIVAMVLAQENKGENSDLDDEEKNNESKSDEETDSDNSNDDNNSKKNEDEEENEDNKSDEEPSQSATKIIGVFFKNIEKEILK